jgi:hypothetical protein
MSEAGGSERERAEQGSRVGRGLEDLAVSSSRRGFLARVSKALAAVTAAGTVSKLVQPGEADGYHFCGHIYTTDSCPHPLGRSLPRIDRAGFPLRGKDGKRIDNLGRLVNKRGEPVGEDGKPLRDPDGRPLPPAPRTKLCEDITHRQFKIPVQVDGSWYRCCGGQVRKLVDCCSTHKKRINGDAALRGYCFKNRKVFCVMYFDTNVPC